MTLASPPNSPAAELDISSIVTGEWPERERMAIAAVEKLLEGGGA